jgi:hypothetical protein
MFGSREMSEQVHLMRVVVASPGDVPTERDHVNRVVQELNGGIARERGLRLEVARWETDTHPGFHPEGPQGLIDPLLRIDQSDVLIGIFWKRFGTPTHDAQSGTEHEFRMAYAAWQQRQRPQIMVYFCQAPYTPKTRSEIDQWGRVLDFREQFPREGLWWPYEDERDFERLLRGHLTNFLLTPAPRPPNPAPSQDYRQTVINEIALRLKALSTARQHTIAESINAYAVRTATHTSLSLESATLAYDLAICMVDQIPVLEVIPRLIRLTDGASPAESHRIADIVDLLLPLNYISDVVETLRAQVVQGGCGLVEHEATTWSLAEIIMAGYEQKAMSLYIQKTGLLRGKTAEDYGEGPPVGPGNHSAAISGNRYAVRETLLHLLTRLQAAPQRMGPSDIEADISDYSERLKEVLIARQALNRYERCTYFVLQLPDDENDRDFLKTVLDDVGRKVPGLFFIELAMRPKRQGETAVDQYLRHIVQHIRSSEEPLL